MADIVMAYSASHAPMMSADKESAPPDQAERFFGGLAKVRQQAADSRPQAIVFMGVSISPTSSCRTCRRSRSVWAAGIRGRWRSVEDTEDDHPRWPGVG